jgi:hypothetical protein
MTFVNTVLSLRLEKSFCRGKKTTFFIFFQNSPRRMLFSPLEITFFHSFRLNSPRVKCKKHRSNVRMTKTFSEILREQLSQNPSENSGESFDSPYSSDVDYAYFSEIKFTRTQVFTPPPPANSRSRYRSQVRLTPTDTTIDMPIDYILESHQKTSLDYLNERLSPTQRLIGQFTAQQLKTAFRRLAKASHPDTGGSPEDFRELITHFKVLSLFLSTLK